ncbi:MAG TPA: hypothetical protein VE219_06480 [Candidatus Sulfotelmatobacter sp.]|nr:hypothetical protein [Candidatus Sulfotelmatobacter sp.]
MLGQLESRQRVVIADMEAGVGTITRMGEGSFDHVLLVSEPTIKATEVAKRARQIIDEAKLGPIVVVANKVRTPEDLDTIQSELGRVDIVIPEDIHVVMADQNGLSPFDAYPDAPAVKAVLGLVRRLTSTESVPVAG